MLHMMWGYTTAALIFILSQLTERAVTNRYHHTLLGHGLKLVFSLRRTAVVPDKLQAVPGKHLALKIFFPVALMTHLKFRQFKLLK